MLNPLTGAGSLAPYKYHFLGDGAYTYLLDQQLPWKLVFFMIYCLMLYGLANVILRKREEVEMRPYSFLRVEKKTPQITIVHDWNGIFSFSSFIGLGVYFTNRLS